MHTNELSTTPNHLFEVEIISIKFITCFVRDFEMCQDLHKAMEYDVEFEECVFHSFQLCQKGEYVAFRPPSVLHCFTVHKILHVKETYRTFSFGSLFYKLL